jgi:GH24 family phage-related lysozyme (muramidase)
MLKVGPKARALIREFEGLKLTAYAATADERARGIWTIGYGATRWPDGRPVKRGDVWTLAMAEASLDHEIDQRAAKIAAAIGNAPTSPGQFGAIVSLSYNAGVTGVVDSTLLRKHCARDCAGAEAQFARWNKQGETVLAGLTRRRAAEAALYRE